MSDKEPMTVQDMALYHVEQMLEKDKIILEQMRALKVIMEELRERTEKLVINRIELEKKDKKKKCKTKK